MLDFSLNDLFYANGDVIDQFEPVEIYYPSALELWKTGEQDRRLDTDPDNFHGVSNETVFHCAGFCLTSYNTRLNLPKCSRCNSLFYNREARLNRPALLLGAKGKVY